MLLIKCLTKKMEDEICDVKQYSIDALKYKESRPELASIYHEIAQTEMNHFKKLHEQTTKLVEEIRDSGKTIPSGMVEKFEYKHDCLIEKQAEAKQFLDMYESKML